MDFLSCPWRLLEQRLEQTPGRFSFWKIFSFSLSIFSSSPTLALIQPVYQFVKYHPLKSNAATHEETPTQVPLCGLLNVGDGTGRSGT